MILIEPLKYCLDVVSMFNGLEKEQLAFLLQKEYVKRNTGADIDKLIRMRLLHKKDNIIYLPQDKKVNGIIEVLAYFLDIWDNDIVTYEKGQHPFLLTYVKLKENNAYKFSVCRYEDIINEKRKFRLKNVDDRIVIVSNTCDLKLPTTNNFYIAVMENNHFNFYKNNLEVGKNEF